MTRGGNPFSGMTTGSGCSPRHPRLSLGEHVVVVEALDYVAPRLGGHLLFVSLRIVQSSALEMPLGSAASACVDLGNRYFADRNLRALVRALVGSDIVPAEWHPAQVEPALRPYLGRTVRATVTRITTRAGRPFDRVVWSSL